MICFFHRMLTASTGPRSSARRPDECLFSRGGRDIDELPRSEGVAAVGGGERRGGGEGLKVEKEELSFQNGVLWGCGEENLPGLRAP